MPTNFKPIYSITPGIAKSLMRIEAAKEKVALLPVNPTVLASLRETAKLYTTHYSKMYMNRQGHWSAEHPAATDQLVPSTRE